MSDTPIFSALPDFSALIASRICHDLISPIGAIGNGVELLTMEQGGGTRPEFALIAASVANANARIRLFRIAFGAATGDQRIARNEVLSILTDLGHAGRITYAWTSTGDLSRREIRLVFLLLLCLETVLPYGGRVEVTQSDMGWTIQADAQRTKLDPSLWAMLTDPAAQTPVEAAQVQFALVGRDLAQLGRALHSEITATGLTLRV
jgi:histidine phosphotransferase ChpT